MVYFLLSLFAIHDFRLGLGWQLLLVATFEKTTRKNPTNSEFIPTVRILALTTSQALVVENQKPTYGGLMHITAEGSRPEALSCIKPHGALSSPSQQPEEVLIAITAWRNILYSSIVVNSAFDV